jgi:hypothetical protein
VKPVHHNDAVGVLDLEHVVERCGRHVGAAGLDRPRGLVPVDPLDRIAAGDDVRAALDQPEHLLRLEADVGIDEQEMRRFGIIQEHRGQIGPRARDQRIAVAQQHLELEIGHAVHGTLEREDRARIDARHLPAETWRGHHQFHLLRHRQLRPAAILTKR